MAYPNDQRNPLAAIPVYVVPAPGGGGTTGTQVNNIASAGSSLVSNAPGVLLTLLVGVGAAGATLEIYDGEDESGPLLATVSGDAPVSLTLNMPFSTGLFVRSTGDANYTLIYS